MRTHAIYYFAVVIIIIGMLVITQHLFLSIHIGGIIFSFDGMLRFTVLYIGLAHAPMETLEHDLSQALLGVDQYSLGKYMLFCYGQSLLLHLLLFSFGYQSLGAFWFLLIYYLWLAVSMVEGHFLFIVEMFQASFAHFFGYPRGLFYMSPK